MYFLVTYSLQVTLLHLPVDIVMKISSEQYMNMDIANLLKDLEAWERATPQDEVIWFTKFFKESGWQQLVDQIMALGHLLSGAPLAKLAELANMPEPTIHGGDPTSYSAIGHHLNHTNFNALRVQELWEGLPEKELLWMFFSLSNCLSCCLDSQIICIGTQQAIFWKKENKFNSSTNI